MSESLENGSLSCPFCSYEPPGNSTNPGLAGYNLAYHVEITHREYEDEDSPFAIQADEEKSDRNPATDQASLKHEAEKSISSDERSTGSSHHESREARYVECPKRCGEYVPPRELSHHLDLHETETIVLADRENAPGRLEPYNLSPRRNYHGARQSYVEARSHALSSPTSVPIDGSSRRPSPARGSKSSWKDRIPLPRIRNRTPEPKGTIRRLGKKELGPHAYEEEMPSWLYKQLEQGPPITWTNQIGRDGQLIRVEKIANETPGLIPVLGQLCAADKHVSKAWLCSTGVKHIYKMHREGGFCGYRNIQMQISWMQISQFAGHEHFPGGTPRIVRLQNLIEDAWDRGFNSNGRNETGGIIGTRKYIGTPEAQALFQSLGIRYVNMLCHERPNANRTRCNARAFTRNKIDRSQPAFVSLQEYVLDYFSADTGNGSAKVYQTNLPPIYFQHPGHSLTIVGVEVKKSGRVNLLVFDPMCATNPDAARLVGQSFSASQPEKFLKAFRRGEDYLKKYKSFEVMTLEPSST